MPQLRQAALTVKIKQAARDAIRRIDPSIDVENLAPKMGGDEFGDDEELDFDL
jgi:hypothetical protein